MLFSPRAAGSFHFVGTQDVLVHVPSITIVKVKK